MSREDGYLGEDVAGRYDESYASLFEPESIDPVVDLVGVTIGDFATARADGTFMVAYLVFNTIRNLRTQDEQVACFRNVAAHLEPGGRFVLEVMVADLQRLPPGETSRPFDLSADHVGLDEYDVATQALCSRHFSLVGGSWVHTIFPGRYVWPSELDLMAELASMTLRDRWADWNRESFASESRKHVSVWEKP